MTSTTFRAPGVDDSPVTVTSVTSWVAAVAELTTPDRITWCDGSAEEWQRLTAKLVTASSSC